MLQNTIAPLPRATNILAIELAKANLAKCFKFNKKPLQADEQKESPETAM
jgi:hypothetical protein